jgi:hypothetical protein
LRQRARREGLHRQAGDEQAAARHPVIIAAPREDGRSDRASPGGYTGGTREQAHDCAAETSIHEVAHHRLPAAADWSTSPFAVIVRRAGSLADGRELQLP